MAQHDYNIANAAGATFRSDLNAALSAIVSQNSGATEPTTTFPYMWWADATTGLMKQRNSSNSAWLTLFVLGKDYPAFPSATKMLFYQSTAPTGWTAVAVNDHALRVVSSGGTGGTTGGADNFSTLFGTSKSTAGFTLTISEMPAHTHTTPQGLSGSGGFGIPSGSSNLGSISGSAGGGGSHSHTLNNMNLRFADVIIATKD